MNQKTELNSVRGGIRMKRLAAVLTLCAFLLCCILPAAVAEQSLKAGDYTYILQADGTAEIILYEGSEETVTVPLELNGTAVTAIGPSAFQANKTLAELVIRDGIVSLGDYALRRCTSLAKVTLPATLTEIGMNPFEGCAALTDLAVAEGNPNLYLSDGVLYSREDSRLVCYPMTKDLSAYTLPEGTRIIGASAFYGNESITQLVVFDTVRAIGRRAFYQCGNLRYINLQDTNISTVGADAFNGCRKLMSIAFPARVNSIADRAFQDCTALTELVFPENITFIGEMAFRNCESLTSVRLPVDLTTIGKNTFAGCVNLTELILPEELFYIGGGAFQNCESLTGVSLPASVDYIGSEAFDGCVSLETISIPDTCSHIGAKAFCRCQSLKSVAVPSWTYTINPFTFSGCVSLTDIRLPAELEEIGESAFFCCYMLKEIVIPDPVEVIGDKAFSNCMSLENIELPEDLENIGPDTFENCVKLAGLPDLSDLYEE